MDLVRGGRRSWLRPHELQGPCGSWLERLKFGAESDPLLGPVPFTVLVAVTMGIHSE